MSKNPMTSRLLPFATAAIGVGCLSLMDAFMKEAALATGTFTATVLRSLIGAAIIAPFWFWSKSGWPAKATMKLHVERGIISAFMALSFFFSLTKLPLAEAIAISFIAPLIALYLARILLDEVIQPKAILASMLGFSGTIVIIAGKIGQDDLDNDAALGLAALMFSALLYAYNFVVIRKQSQLAGPVEIATFHSGIGGLVLLFFAPFLATPIVTDAILPLALAGLLTVLGAMAIAWAYARAEAQALVPIEYSGFLWASVLGWAFFREEVTLPTVAGTALIVTGCWLAARNGELREAQSA